jgi:hypothetical protein
LEHLFWDDDTGEIFRDDDTGEIFQDDELCCRAMELFYATGHTFSRKSQTTDRDIRDFVYIDITHNHVFTPDEWLILDCVRSASLLFTKGTEYFCLAPQRIPPFKLELPGF